MLQRSPSRLITVSNLIDAATGKLNRDVYEALVRREASRTFGSIAPRYIREASKLYRDHVAQHRISWMASRGLPVAISYVRPFEGGFGGAF